ncbi:MAG: KH domain-containing protein [Armatimonadetes bacterium]|nr:KH domain-containing protein [Armatimonadota bacterium]
MSKMHEIEIRAKTIDEGRRIAAFQLGVSEDKIEIEIVEEPRETEGELGGTYKVRARLREDAFSPRSEEVKAEEAPARTEASELDLSRYSLSATDEDYEEEEDAVPSDSGTPSQPRGASDEDYEEEELDEPNLEVAKKAREFLEGFVQLMGIEAEVALRYTGSDEVQIELVGADLGLLIGRYGSTLDAIQLLTAAAANKSVTRGARVILDAENYRQRRRETLENLAAAAAAKARRTRQPVELTDLRPHERRIIHLALRDNPDVETYSEGEGNRRKLIVAPRQTGARGRGRSPR